MAQVSYGTITITDTNDIERIYVEYCRSTSNQLSGNTVPNITVNWGESTPSWVNGQYIWQRSVIKKSGIDNLTYGTPVCLTGAQGQTGGTGRSLTGTETKYTSVASNTTQSQVEALAESNWINNVPSYNSNKPDYWVRIKNTYDKAPLTEYIYYKDNGITDSIAKANEAWNKADQAQSDASDALGAAQAANEATALLGGHFIYNSEWQTTNTPHSANVVQTILKNGIDVTTDPSKWDYNVHIGSNGIRLRNNESILSEWTSTALKFNNPSNGNTQLIIGANGVLQSGNYVYTSGTYSDSGTKIDLTNGSIYTPGFRTDGSNTYIRGEINAVSGKIGNNNTNYWTIGNNFNYDQTASAALISHGTAFIQLDTSNTWRLSTDRIHTAWNGTDGSAALMFPKDGNTYWDWGIHSPHKTGSIWKDKFVYARKYTNTTDDDFTNRDNLSNDIDDDIGTWIYQFYIDKNGSIYARNFYLLNEDGTPGSNIGGQDAVYLLKTGGTITGNLTVNGTITGNLTGTASNASKVNNLTVQTAVPANAVFTDKNVRSTQNNTTKIWLVGTPDGGDRTGEVNYDSNIYLTTTAGTLHATTFEGNLSGTATKANQDGDGNVIKTTYLKLSGGNVTGPVRFGSSVSADELTVGDLVVNGAASFTNNLQVNTINGVSVSSSPKFTDTVTTVTVTGNGNAITAASASNGVVTLTKGTTFLTSYTETDPIFVASAAHGITNTDISNWNSKTSNTGTVTSVRVQASSPLQSSTSTAQSSTLNTTISFVNQNKNLVLAGPSSGNAAAPTFRSLVAADIPNLSWNKITSDKPTTLSGYGITDAAGSNAIVGLSASSNSAGVTTFTATRASGTNPLSFEVSIVASAATGASALKDSNGLISKGSETKPVYFNNGVPAEANTYAGGTAVTLNGSGKGASTASFYAPTTAGTTNQVLIGGGNAPTWTNISDLVPSSAASATYATYDASESSNTTKTTIANKYVKKSGDTMTNILTLYREGTTANNYPAGMKFSIKDTTTGQTYSNAYIFAYQDHGSTTYGANMVICSGGGMFIGSGESPANHYSAKGASYTGEDTFITADGGTWIQSNGNTIANRIGFCLTSSHEVVPTKTDTLTNNIGSIGTSTYKWANMYATTFHGALDGNATTATSLNGGTALSSKNLNDYHDTSGKLNYYYAGGSNSCTNVPIGDGTQFGMVTYNSAGGHVTQELSSFSSATNKGKWIRWYQNSTWTDWEKFLTSANYSDYTVTKTGGGASGTWGISISGNAANVSGTVAIGHGGTGATTAAAARSNLGTWSLVSDSYNTLMPADGTTNGWIKFGTSNTSYGILPSAAGNAGSGHNYIGTSSWYWKYAYIDQIYGYLNGSISGNAATATKSGISTIWLYPENSNEINIGGTSTSSMLYFGYRAKDSRPIPNKIIFGGSTGSTELQALSFNMINKANMYYDSTLEAIVFSFA